MLFKTLILSLSVALNVELSLDSEVCPEIQVKVTINPAESKTSSISFEISGGTAPYNLIFFDSKGMLVSQDFSLKTFNRMASGNYQCLVVDQNNCSNRLNIKIP